MGGKTAILDAAIRVPLCGKASFGCYLAICRRIAENVHSEGNRGARDDEISTAYHHGYVSSKAASGVAAEAAKQFER